MLPPTSETAGMLDGRRLALLPDGALLVNAGRGPTIELNALVRELAAGRLRNWGGIARTTARDDPDTAPSSP